MMGPHGVGAGNGVDSCNPPWGLTASEIADYPSTHIPRSPRRSGKQPWASSTGPFIPSRGSSLTTCRDSTMKQMRSLDMGGQLVNLDFTTCDDLGKGIHAYKGNSDNKIDLNVNIIEKTIRYLHARLTRNMTYWWWVQDLPVHRQPGAPPAAGARTLLSRCQDANRRTTPLRRIRSKKALCRIRPVIDRASSRPWRP